MHSPPSSTSSHERRLVVVCAVLFSLLAWGALVDALFDLI